ncbi:hypothetical protein [Salisaeta longa]|uniref:hypothetical protein n=1 Tax=Salisaeta longa TaxID=503170 RepID=UPI0003B7931D|nr:hypothetical protein [Salisaeta longa]
MATTKAKPPQQLGSTGESAEYVSDISLRGILCAAFLAGGAFIFFEYATHWMGADNPMGPTHFIPKVLNFEPGPQLVTYLAPILFIHFVIATLVTVPLGWLIHRRSKSLALPLGTSFGLSLYALTYFILNTEPMGVGQHVAVALVFAGYGTLTAWIYKVTQ